MMIVGPVCCIATVTDKFIRCKIKAQYFAGLRNAKRLHIIHFKNRLQLKFVLRSAKFSVCVKNQFPFSIWG